MQKIKSYIRISLGSNIKNTILIIIILLSLFVLILFILINFNVPKSSKYYIPKNMAYVDNISEEDLKYLEKNNIKFYETIPLKETKYEVRNPLVSTTKISLLNMNYSKNTSLEVVQNNQEKINLNHIVEPIGIKYNFTNNIVGEKDIDLQSDVYNIDYMIFGSFPKNENEVIIGENTANYYLEEKGLDNYKDLIGTTIKIKTECSEDYCDNIPEEYKMFEINRTYSISGIYKQKNYDIDTIEDFIINPSDNIKEIYLDYNKSVPNAYYIEAPSYKALKSILIESSDIKIISYKDIKVINYFQIILVFGIIFLNLMLFYMSRKNIKKLYYILTYYKYSKLKIFLIAIIPFIFFNLICFFIYYIIN